MDNFELYYRLNKDGSSEKITGVPPLSFVSNGENLSDCRIYGASGGVGDRTVNLFDGSYTRGMYLNPDGNVTIDVWSSEWALTDYIPVDSDTVILSGYFKGLSPSIALYDSQKNLKNARNYNIDPNAPTQYHEKVITADGAAYCRFSVKFIEPQYINTLQLQTGSTATAYEPYGYKIPIVVAGKNLFDENTVTEDAFLYVNDGTARKNSSGTANVSGYIPTKKSRKYILTFSAESVPNGFTTVACYYDTSKQYTQQQDSFATATSSERYFFELVPQNDGYIRVNYPSSAFNLQVEDSDSATDYEPHYESQTAAIYLNEPLAEGESISSRSAGVSIPTINGTTILSVDTAVQPSRIDVALTSKQSKMADSMLKYFSYKYGKGVKR